MNPRTLKALKGSIKKWEEILTKDRSDRGWRDCPLCKLFYEKCCQGCPVRRHTGLACCDQTPYEFWEELNASEKTLMTPIAELAARAEIQFLKNLLPKKTPCKS